MPRKIRTSKDEETQPPLTQRPGFIIGMTFLGVVAAVIISVLIFRFIQRRRKECEREFDALVQKMQSEDTDLDKELPSLEKKIAWLQTYCYFNGEKNDKLFKYYDKVRRLKQGGDGEMQALHDPWWI